MTRPLTGILVLDLTSVVAGPLATQTFGDMGAEVVKIESPDGDTTRYTGPARSPDMAALFMGLNRGKRSLVLDLKQSAAVDALWRLIERADVFVHSMRPQKIDRLGFGHRVVCGRNPRIVYAGLHGYRNGGPYSGLAALMAEIAGEPRYAPTILADKTTALTLASAVTAALFAREKTGRGHFVEVPMFETMIAFVLAEHLFGHAAARRTRLHPRTRRMAEAVQNARRLYLHDGLYRGAVAQILERRRRAGNLRRTRFDSIATRSRKRRRPLRTRGRRARQKTTDEWLALLRQLEIPSARMSSLDEVMLDPQLAASGFFKRATHPSEGEILFTDQPVRFGDGVASSARLHAAARRVQRRNFTRSWSYRSRDPGLLKSGATVDSNRKAEAAE